MDAVLRQTDGSGPVRQQTDALCLTLDEDYSMGALFWILFGRSVPCMSTNQQARSLKKIRWSGYWSSTHRFPVSLEEEEEEKEATSAQYPVLYV